MPFYDVILRGLVLAVFLLVVLRVIGKRLVAEVSPVDFVVALTVGTIAGSATITSTVPLRVGMLGIAVWAAFEWVNVHPAVAPPGWERLVSGRSLPLVEKGQVVKPSLRRALLSERNLFGLLAEKRVTELEVVDRAEFLPSGKLGLETRKKAEKGDQDIQRT